MLHVNIRANTDGLREIRRKEFHVRGKNRQLIKTFLVTRDREVDAERKAVF